MICDFNPHSLKQAVRVVYLLSSLSSSLVRCDSRFVKENVSPTFFIVIPRSRSGDWIAAVKPRLALCSPAVQNNNTVKASKNQRQWEGASKKMALSIKSRYYLGVVVAVNVWPLAPFSSRAQRTTIESLSLLGEHKTISQSSAVLHSRVVDWTIWHLTALGFFK